MELVNRRNEIQLQEGRQWISSYFVFENNVKQDRQRKRPPTTTITLTLKENSQIQKVHCDINNGTIMA